MLAKRGPRSEGGGCLRRMGSAILKIVTLVIVITVTASLAGTRASAGLREKHPPIGELIDIGGYRLHLYCQGPEDSAGSPVVVMEATVGTPGLIWSLVQPEVAKSARACVYDRAGLGWSDPSPRSRSTDVMVAELHTLLDRAGIPGPYVLVGNSAAGWLIRYYAHTYPEDLAGMVLVDSAHEEQFQRIPGEVSPLVQRAFDLFPVLFKSRIPAHFPSLIPVYGKDQLPEPAMASYQALMAAEIKFSETMSAEISAVQENLSQVRAARITSLGDIPLVVLTHDRLDAIPGVTTSSEASRQVEQAWLELQSELAALSPNGRLVVAKGSGHNIQFERPDLVIAAILEVLAEAKAKAGGE